MEHVKGGVPLTTGGKCIVPLQEENSGRVFQRICEFVELGSISELAQEGGGY